MCRRPDQIPHLGKILRGGSLTVWMASLSPMDAQVMGHPHLVRMFPYGGIILLTASLILYQPSKALKILRWFRLLHLPAKPAGSWKIAMYPRVKEWLGDILDLCNRETHQTPFGYPIQVIADIYQEVFFLLERKDLFGGQMVEDDDEEIPTHEAPIVSERLLPNERPSWTGDKYENTVLDRTAIEWNDENLIHWFSQWVSGRNIEHRRFQVILGYSKNSERGAYVTACYKKGYGYLEEGIYKPGLQERGLIIGDDGAVLKDAWERNWLDIMSYEECFQINRIPSTAYLDQKHDAWLQSLRKGLENDEERSQ